MTRTRRRLAITAAIALALTLTAFAGLHLAARQLQRVIEGALGPRASIGAIDLGLTGITLSDVRIRAASGWPAADELRARRVRIVPELRSLAGGPWRVASVQVDDGYVSVLRTRDGRMRLLPALLEDHGATRQPAAEAGTAPRVEIARVELGNAVLAFFDASVRQPPWPLRLEKLRVEVGPLSLPSLDRPIGIHLDGVFDGPRRDGRLTLAGTYTPAKQDAVLRARFTGVDLAALQPYLLKVSDTGVRRGTLDLELDTTLTRNHLHAPGKLVLADLELADGGGPLSTFAGVPRKAVLAAMSEKGRLEVKFTLDGRLDDPSFSLNENLAARVATGLAESLGVSLSGVAKGLTGIIGGLFK